MTSHQIIQKLLNYSENQGFSGMGICYNLVTMTATEQFTPEQEYRAKDIMKRFSYIKDTISTGKFMGYWFPVNQIGNRERIQFLRAILKIMEPNGTEY